MGQPSTLLEQWLQDAGHLLDQRSVIQWALQHFASGARVLTHSLHKEEFHTLAALDDNALNQPWKLHQLARPMGTDHLLWVVRAEPFQTEHITQVSLCAAHLGALLAKEAQMHKISSHRYAALLDAGFEGICIHRNGVILEVNESLAQIYGYSRQEMVGMPVIQTVAPGWLDRVRKVVREGYEDAYDTMALGATGEHIPLRARAKSIIWDGKPARVAVFLDLRKQHQSERALEFSEARLNEAQRMARMGSFHLSNDLQTTWASVELRRMLGLAPDAPLDLTTFIRHLAADAREHAAEAIDDAWTMGRALKLDTSVCRSNGASLDIALSIEPVLEAERVTALSFTVQDISERKQLEGQLIQSQKMEGLGRLAGGLAHDINNTLFGVISFIAVAKDELDPALPQQEDLDMALEAANKASQIVNQVLTFSRRRPAQPVQLNPNQEINDITRMLDRLLDDNITLELELDPDLWDVRMGTGQISQIATNMAINAADAMPEGGKLTISTRNIPQDYLPTHLARSNRRDHVLLSIRDTGEGIPAEHLEHIFEPFYTTKTVTKGTGLGLSICYGLVQQTGGHIEVRSKPGQGTDFLIHLPRSTEREHHTPQPLILPPWKPEQLGAVLLVEDDPGVRMALIRLLRNHDFTVYPAPDANRALDIYRKHTAELSMVLTDIMMPGTNGTELTRTLRAEGATLPIICMSGYTDDLIDPDNFTALKAAFIDKPFTITHLHKAFLRATRLSPPARPPTHG